MYVTAAGALAKMEKASQDNIIKVVPGMTIGSSCDFKSGPGTFVRDGDVIASRVGFQVISKDIPGRTICTAENHKKYLVLLFPSRMECCSV